MKPRGHLWRGYLYILAWSAGTACAAAIAWQGVYGVYVQAIYRGQGDRTILTPKGAAAPPRAPEDGAGNPETANPPAPRREGRRPWSSPRRGSGADRRDGSGADRRDGSSRTGDRARTRAYAPGTGPAGAARTRRYDLAGGVVLLAQTRTSARLAAARPATGWRKESWFGDGWLRVDFTRGDRAATLIATWNGHPPEIRLDNDV